MSPRFLLLKPYTLMSENNSPLTPLVLWTMTISTGLCVANLYYCQPLLHQMQTSFAATEQQVGWIPTLTQVGYALGMLFFVPLGDLFEKRKLIFLSTFISAICLVAMALSPNIYVGIGMSLLLGLATMTPQFIIPFAAHLAPPEKRGQILGTVMSGLLIGILLARTVAGFLGAAFGWRAMFMSAAVLLFILSLLLRTLLPTDEPTYKGSYASLLKSITSLVKQLPTLREAMVFGAMLFAAFSAFWATLIHLMETPDFNLGARTVGLFGILGASGALAAPILGRWADRRSRRMMIGYGILLNIIAFLIFGIWGGTSLVALSLGVLVMDVGIQGAHVSNQTRIFALNPEARSRINTAYMFAYFMGGAAGSLVASYAWSLHQWIGVCIVALAFLSIAGLTHFFNPFKLAK
jgi:predicted MFS family arabinose efflux permease